MVSVSFERLSINHQPRPPGDLIDSCSRMPAYSRVCERGREIRSTAVVVDQNAGRPAKNYQWSIGPQRQITPNLMVEAAYMGTRGIWWPFSGQTSNRGTLVNYNSLSPQLLNSYGLSLNNPADLAILTTQVGSPAAGPFMNKLPYGGFL
jgi:hypothetical protein